MKVLGLEVFHILLKLFNIDLHPLTNKRNCMKPKFLITIMGTFLEKSKNLRRIFLTIWVFASTE